MFLKSISQVYERANEHSSIPKSGMPMSALIYTRKSCSILIVICKLCYNLTILYISYVQYCQVTYVSY